MLFHLPLFFLLLRPSLRSTLFPYTTLFRSRSPTTSRRGWCRTCRAARCARPRRSEEHTSELQSPCNLVCRLLLEKKKIFSYLELQKPLTKHMSCLDTKRTIYITDRLLIPLL